VVEIKQHKSRDILFLDNTPQFITRTEIKVIQNGPWWKSSKFTDITPLQLVYRRL